MRVKIEPSGLAISKGLVQIQFAFYLEPSESRYEEHHVQVPIIPPEGYPGERDAIDSISYDIWLESLPKKWQNNPFHKHFIYVEPDLTDKEILDIGEVCLSEAFNDWSHNRRPNPKNKPVKFLESVDNKRLKACKEKVKHLKETALERKL